LLNLTRLGSIDIELDEIVGACVWRVTRRAGPLVDAPRIGQQPERQPRGEVHLGARRLDSHSYRRTWGWLNRVAVQSTSRDVLRGRGTNAGNREWDGNRGQQGNDRMTLSFNVSLL
jgi:hypothetical protein